jgi:XTP/dITP diphosphohydrolase
MKSESMPAERQPEIVIATLNLGKSREIETVLSGLPITFRRLSEFANITEPVEDGSTYEQNAGIKALSYARQTGLAALADDSGLEVRALGGKPGVFSARYAGAGATDRERIEKLLTELGRHTDRAASFVCNAVLATFAASPDEPQISIVTTGICRGTIIEQPRGNNGFGFDPIFVPDGYTETFAQLSPEVKNNISHRAQALNAMRAELAKRLK